MNFNIQSRYCHAERSEASLCPSRQTLRCAQGDNTFPMVLVKVHNRASTQWPSLRLAFSGQFANSISGWMKSLAILFCLILLSSCTQSSPPTSSSTATPTATMATPRADAATDMPTATVGTTPRRYTAHVILSGGARPDDLVFDRQGRLLFSDFYACDVRMGNND